MTGERMPREEVSLELREGKFVFWVGVICSAVFALLFLAAALVALAELDWPFFLFCGAVFGGGIFLGVLLILAYRNHRVCVTLGECSVTNVWGRVKTFRWSEVYSAKLQVTNASFKLRLLNEEGKVIAGVESTMTGAASLAALVQEAGIPVEQDRQPWFETGGETPDWTLPPEQAPWQYAHRRQIKYGLVALSLCECAAIVGSFWMHNARYYSLLWCCLPLVLYAYYLLFPQVLVWEKPARAPEEWKRTHVGFPFALLMVPVLLMLFMADIINLTDAARAWGFGVCLFAVLMLLYWVRTPRHSRTAAITLLVAMLMGFYSFAATYHWNYALRAGKPVHMAAQVVRTRVSTSSKSGDSYYIFVDVGEVEPLELGVSRSVYRAAQAGEPLELCQNQSVFGVPFTLVHRQRAS